MEIPLDEIMKREKFSETEKALVSRPMLSQPDRIKIISEIKIARSNEKHAAAATSFTYILVIATITDIALNARNFTWPLAIAMLIAVVGLASCAFWTWSQYIK